MWDDHGETNVELWWKYNMVESTNWKRTGDRSQPQKRVKDHKDNDLLKEAIPIKPKDVKYVEHLSW